ncbi:MAG: hypothetical protein NC489_21170 [Ruminococcus flavefaciens]|nr:hypothetical protein [Ruminococcus flavefaciens]
MNILDGVKNFLLLINDNWTSLVVLAGVILALYKKVKVYFNKSDEEKIAIAKKHIQETMLKMIGDAEEDYAEWNKAGSLKRAQVIKQIFAENPILSKAVDQDGLIKWLDDTIDDALVTLRKIVEENKEET